MTASSRASDERGQAGAEVLAIVFVVLLGFVLLAVNAWAVVDGRAGVVAAGREAVRAFVEAEDPAAASAAAQVAVDEALRAAGRDPDRAEIRIEMHAFERCAPVRIAVRYPVPTVALPAAVGFPREISVVSTHVGRIDPYRSGLDGEAVCS